MTPVVLAVHFPAKQLAKLRMTAMRLGARVRVVEKREFLSPIGALTGDLDGFESFYDGEDFPDAMLNLRAFLRRAAASVFAGHARGKAAARAAQSRSDGR